MVDQYGIVRERVVLREFLPELGAYTRSQSHEPAKRSPADLLGDPESALTAYGIALALAESAAEHVSLFVDALDEPVRPLAACSCARVVLELSARVQWLLDPELDRIERMGRIFAHRLRGIVQQLKYERSRGRAVVAFEERIEQLAKQADCVGVPVARKKGGRVATIGKMPTATELVSKISSQQAMYRVLSALAHGNSWAILWLCWVPGQETNVGNTAVTSFHKAIRADRLSFLVATVALNLVALIAPLTDFMGWDTRRFRLLSGRLFAELRLEELVARANERYR